MTISGVILNFSRNDEIVEVSDLIESSISQNSSNFSTDIDEYGYVLSVGDGIANVYGLKQVQSGELVEFSNGLKGLALNLEIDSVGVVIFGNDREILDPKLVRIEGSRTYSPSYKRGTDDSKFNELFLGEINLPRERNAVDFQIDLSIDNYYEIQLDPTNEQPYLQYKITILSTKGSNIGCQLGEIMMKGYLCPEEYLMLGNGTAAVDSTPADLPNFAPVRSK